MKLNFLITLLLLSNISYANDLNISTTSGISSGFQINGVNNWDDIPYAQPPVGDLRWRAPQEVLSKSELIEPKADNFCVQKPSGMGGSEFDGDEFFSGSEDCLYLDIKAPKTKSNSLLPVMFWIHGGGNTSGLKDTMIFLKWSENIT